MCFCQKCLNCITPSPRALSKEGGRGIEFSRFLKKWRVQIFPIKMEWLVKQVRLFKKKKKKGGCHYLHTSTFQCYLSFQCLVCVCVCFVYLHIIQYNKGSYREHITGDLNINLYGCVGLLVTECAVYVLCVISNPSTIKKQHYVRINSKIKL